MTKANEVVVKVLREILEEKRSPFGDLSENRILRELGLDSLDWIIIVVKLEEAMGVDPFAEQKEYRIPVTVGDLIGFYEQGEKKPARP